MKIPKILADRVFDLPAGESYLLQARLLEEQGEWIRCAPDQALNLVLAALFAPEAGLRDWLADPTSPIVIGDGPSRLEKADLEWSDSPMGRIDGLPNAERIAAALALYATRRTARALVRSSRRVPKSAGSELVRLSAGPPAETSAPIAPLIVATVISVAALAAAAWVARELAGQYVALRSREAAILAEERQNLALMQAQAAVGLPIVVPSILEAEARAERRNGWLVPVLGGSILAGAVGVAAGAALSERRSP